MKKLQIMLPAALVAVGSFAQSSSPTIDMSAANDAADAIGSAVSGLLTGKVMTNILLVIGGALAIWGIFLVVKYIRRGGSKA